MDIPASARGGVVGVVVQRDGEIVGKACEVSGICSGAAREIDREVAQPSANADVVIASAKVDANRFDLLQWETVLILGLLNGYIFALANNGKVVMGRCSAHPQHAT